MTLRRLLHVVAAVCVGLIATAIVAPHSRATAATEPQQYVQLKGAGAWSVYGPLVSWQNDLASSQSYVNMTYTPHGTLLGREDLIAKRADSPYTDKRSRDWLKFKCEQGQELVVGGFAAPRGSRAEFGALLLGYYDGAGALRYAGKVGTGFDERTLRELRDRLGGITCAESPFAEPVGEPGAHWVRPELVAQVGFGEWTPDGRLRHPRFHGLREDKRAADVRREA